jgi:hypothetical protein
MALSRLVVVYSLYIGLHRMGFLQKISPFLHFEWKFGGLLGGGVVGMVVPWGGMELA